MSAYLSAAYRGTLARLGEAEARVAELEAAIHENRPHIEWVHALAFTPKSKRQIQRLLDLVPDNGA